MSARDRGTEDLAKYLTRLLLAVVVKSGNELRIKESDIDIDTTRVLVRDFDSSTGELVLRASSRYCEFMKVEPEAHAHVTPIEDRMLQLVHQGVVETDRHHVPTDDELIAAERKNAMRRSVRPQGPVT
jgi:hypothetical protein